MSDQESKKGLRVKVRTWESMQCEFGLRKTGTIDCPYGFHPMMKEYCGRAGPLVGWDRMTGQFDGVGRLEQVGHRRLDTEASDREPAMQVELEPFWRCQGCTLAVALVVAARELR